METLPLIPKDFKEDNWKQPLLRKGFVRRGYIGERPGLYPDVRFVYQPMLPEVNDEMTAKISQLPNNRANQANAIIASYLVRYIKTWSLDDKITELNLRMLGETLMNRLRVIVGQIGPSDIDPLWEDETESFKSVDEMLGESLEPLPSE